MKMAKPDPTEIEALIQFLSGLSQVMEKCRSEIEVADYVFQELPKIEAGWQRVVWAGKTCIENACDPNSATLDWKPELRKLVEQLDPKQRRETGRIKRKRD